MPSKIYQASETAITWTDTTGDEAITLANLTAGAGRVGDRRDLTSGASASAIYEWRLVIAGFAVGAAVGETVDLYFGQSDGTHGDGIITYSDSGDAALASTDILPNLKYAGSAVIRSTTITDDIVASGVIALTSRYCAPVVVNNTANALENTNNVHKVILTPIPSEGQ